MGLDRLGPLVGLIGGLSLGLDRLGPLVGPDGGLSLGLDRLGPLVGLIGGLSLDLDRLGPLLGSDVSPAADFLVVSCSCLMFSLSSLARFGLLKTAS